MLALHAALDPPEPALDAWDRLGAVVDLDTCWDEDVLELLGAISANLLIRGGLEDSLVHDAARLRGVHRRNWYASHRHADACSTVRAAFERAGIDSHLMGGIAFACVADLDPGERRADDTMFIVHPDQFLHASDAMTQLGWITGPRRRQRASWFTRPRSFRRPIDPARPDAGRITIRFGVRPSSLAPRSSNDMANAEVHLLVALLGGPTHPPRTGRSWVFDAVRLLRAQTIDADRFWRVVHDWGVVGPIVARLRRLVEDWDEPTIVELASAATADADRAFVEPIPEPLVPPADAARMVRFRSDWRIVTRNDPRWRAVSCIPDLVFERADVDGARHLPAVLRHRLRRRP